MSALLEVDSLRTLLPTGHGRARAAAVDGVSFTLAEGEVLGLVGESGCGKSLTALSLLRLVEIAGARIEGSVRLDGTDLLRLPERAMRRVRGKRIAMIFQEPMTSLNPVLTIGRQITEAIRLHDGIGAAAATARAADMLRLVRMAEPERRLTHYPHQLSGGMRQRAMIALALACAPALLVADEPTTALDVTVQAQILDLLRDLRLRLGMAMLLITHDLGVVAQNCDRVLVMYAGRRAEQAPVRDLFRQPRHPYTRGLIGAVPVLGRRGSGRLAEIPGLVPAANAMPPGCRFAPRCALASAQCHAIAPEWREIAPSHFVACWHADG